MRLRRAIVRTALVCGLAGAAWALFDHLDDHQAYAADRPAAVEQPGGLLDRAGRLPEQASDRAREVVDRVKPRKPECDPPAAGPAKPALPRREPAEEKPAKPRPEDLPSPIGDVVDEVQEVVDHVEEQLPAPSPELDDDRAIAPPSKDAAPPDTEDDVQTKPAPVVTDPVAPAGPAATPTPPPVAGATAAAAATDAEPCDHDRDPLDLVRKAKQSARLAPASRPGDEPCPTTPNTDLTGDGPATFVGKRCQAGSDLMAPTAAGLGRPALQLLRVLWPRSDVADTRTEHPEPGPA